MRKLHLLIAEWRLEQRLKDERTHKLMCAFGWKPGEGVTLGDVFPLLADAGSQPAASDDDPDDVEQIFGEPASALFGEEL